MRRTQPVACNRVAVLLRRVDLRCERLCWMGQKTGKAHQPSTGSCDHDAGCPAQRSTEVESGAALGTPLLHLCHETKK
jgi:hypothetical protein